LHWASLAPGGQGSTAGGFSARAPELKSTVNEAKNTHQRMARL
jgi:hypothetical protein